MKKCCFRVLLGTCLSLYGMSCMALFDGFYTGMALGYSSSGYSENNVRVDIPQFGLTDVTLNTAANSFVPALATTPNSAAVQTDTSDAGGRIYLGYKFQKLFGIETGYTRFADAVINNVFHVSPDQFNVITGTTNLIVGTNTRVEQQSIDLSGKVFVPVLDLFQVWGQLGVAYVDTSLPDKASFVTKIEADGVSTLTNIKISRSNQYHYEMLYGFGAGYSWDDRFNVDLAFQQMQPSGNTIQSSSLVSIDFTVSFG